MYPEPRPNLAHEARGARVRRARLPLAAVNHSDIEPRQPRRTIRPLTAPGPLGVKSHTRHQPKLDVH